MSQELKTRTKKFALEGIRFVESLPRSRTADHIGKQLLRSATSVGSNYRAACRARSPAEFVAKLGIVEEEADECMFWLELLEEGGTVVPGQVNELKSEADELVAIMVASIKTARDRGT